MIGKGLYEDRRVFISSAAILVAQSREPSRVKLYLSKYLSQEHEARQPTHAEAKKHLSQIK